MLLSYQQLIRLTRELRATPVLSVYIDGAAPDPAQRVMWRQVLRNAMDDARAGVETESKAARGDFERCAQFLEAALDEIPSAIGAPGWVGFITSGGVKLAGAVPVPMPTLAKWQVGAWVSPYVRALKQTHPVFVALVDARSGRLYRYQAGALEKLEKLDAHIHGGRHADHMGDAPRMNFKGGTRGETAREAAQRVRLAARDQMLRELAAHLADLLKEDGSALIGGVLESAHALHRAIPDLFASRVVVSTDLSKTSSEAEIAFAAERDASVMRNARDSSTVGHALDLAASNGRGVAGAKETIAAMSSGAGQQLLITPRFLAEHAGEAEAAVEFALDHDAEIELLGGEAAERLDTKAGGIAALLRYVEAAGVGAEDVVARG